MEGPLWWVLADNSHQGKSSNLTGSFFFYLLILPVTKRWRSDGHLLVQKGTKNRAKPPNEVTVPQGNSAIVRGPEGPGPGPSLVRNGLKLLLDHG